ncbi:hypothetical protein WP12_00285 [Sphingomonas sp. SRS2]|nr:hypothetical protein WP12_00285 [Sphingomonas sp. SRS2]
MAAAAELAIRQARTSVERTFACFLAEVTRLDLDAFGQLSTQSRSFRSATANGCYWQKLPTNAPKHRKLNL